MPKVRSLPRGLIFDFDNTLYHADAAYAAALASCGIAFGLDGYEKARTLAKSRLPADSTQRHHRLLYFKHLQPRLPPADLLALMHAYETELEAQIAKQWRELGRLSLLSRWAQKYPMVILTNENVRTQIIKWRACDPQGTLFQNLICSEEVGAAKPHEAMFAAACAALGLPASACLMVGDSLRDDVLPALGMGMQALQTVEFLAANAPKHQDAALLLPSLESLDMALCP